MKKEFVTNTFLIGGIISVASSLTMLVAGAFWIPNMTDLAFIIPFLGGGALFFVGTYREAKYSDTYGIPMYISNRKVKMRSAVLGCTICVAATLVAIMQYI